MGIQWGYRIWIWAWAYLRVLQNHIDGKRVEEEKVPKQDAVHKAWDPPKVTAPKKVDEDNHLQ